MENDESSEIDLSALSDLDMDTDRLFEVLSDPRRRFVLSCLSEYRTPMPLADVADELAIWEHGEPITEIPAEEVKSIYITLYHQHVPKMERLRIVEYSQEHDTLELAENSDDLLQHVSLPSI